MTVLVNPKHPTYPDNKKKQLVCIVLYTNFLYINKLNYKNKQLWFTNAKYFNQMKKILHNCSQTKKEYT